MVTRNWTLGEYDYKYRERIFNFVRVNTETDFISI